MCGLVGCWSTKQGVHTPENIFNMLDEIAYRGPDDKGVWLENNLSLGHVRLSILDLSIKGHQPFVSDDESAVIVYNGEVYNFPELREELLDEGFSFKSTSDTEVVFNAIRCWGVNKAIRRFNGMFAFAYYDINKGELYLGRDRLGIKPLYLFSENNTLIFSSEIKAIFKHPLATKTPDLHVLSVLVLNQRLEGRLTPFNNVKAVLPGSYLKITSNKVSEHIYYDPLDNLNVDKLLDNANRTDSDILSNFSQKMTNSVQIHLNSDAPVATMCSGGVDSSLITAYAKDYKPDIVSYVADVKGTISEGQKAKLVGKHLGVEIRQVDVEKEDFLRLWPKAVWQNDQPNFHANDIPFMAVANAVRADGIKVLLTGEGADELFGGYPWQHRVWKMWKRRRLQKMFVPNNAFTRKLGTYLNKLSPLDWDELSQHPFSYRNKVKAPVTQNSVADHMQQFVLFGGQRMLRQQQIFEKFSPVSPIEDAALLSHCVDDLYGYLQCLLQRNDRMGMSASIESRFPFIENEVIDFAMHLPLRAKLRKGTEKWAVRTVASQRLPAQTISAEKIGFAVPDSMWVSGLPLLDGGVCSDVFKWDLNMEKSIIHHLRSHPRFIYTMVAIELWLRLFIRNESIESLEDKLLFSFRATV